MHTYVKKIFKKHQLRALTAALMGHGPKKHRFDLGR